MELIHQVVLDQSLGAIVPLWNRKATDIDDDVRTLEHWGYKEFMTQTVMVLKAPLPDVGEPDCADLYCIRTQQDAQRWSDIVSRSFGYFVESHVVEKLLHDTCVTLVILSASETEIGSACIFYKDGIAGIHYVGVLPQYRRSGMATRLMRKIIHLCCTMGAACVTLQASPQAVHLYKKMGFVELLKYKNYSFAGSHP
jgi:ribosomal protein S18 acetylase RimI-like enzyme